MPTPTNPTLTLADALAAIDAGLSGISAQASEFCVTPGEFAASDRDYDALWSVGKLVTLLADLLDGVLADDPQAIRDAAAWLTVNRPAVPGGDGVGEGER